MSAPLDSRVIRIVRWLVDQPGVRSTADLAGDLGLSERVVRYRLATAENYLREWGAELHRHRGAGLYVVADDSIRSAIVADLNSRSEAPRVYAPEERGNMLIAALLWAAPDITSLDRIHEELEVSKTSARRDLQICEPWLERNGLPLVRRSGQGIMVVGPERRIRQVIVQLVLETIPEDVLEAYLGGDDTIREQRSARIAVGMRERLEALPLREAALAVRASPLGQRLAAGRGEMVFSLYVAVSIARIRAGRPIDVEAGRQRSAIDHPVAEAVSALVPEFEALIEGPMEAAEVGAVTEYLLGLDTLQLTSAVAEPLEESLVDELLAIAGLKLHPVLVDDAELRRGLLAHVGRLRVRLRHGLPVHNPLLDEVRTRYEDVHIVARQLGQALEAELGTTIVEDEVGFLTMYLCGAMERARLKPRRRALVVCPSGMATVWVLVSRIQAEFPELELVEVLSETGYEALDHRDYDLVISTIAVAEHAAPVVVVGALLSAGDVARVATHL
ncbi:MAG: BglG family transcription antiterminator [Acidimicrobiales bacterium]